jgi:hypothetical protein
MEMLLYTQREGEREKDREREMLCPHMIFSFSPP